MIIIIQNLEVQENNRSYMCSGGKEIVVTIVPRPMIHEHAVDLQ